MPARGAEWLLFRARKSSFDFSRRVVNHYTTDFISNGLGVSRTCDEKAMGPTALFRQSDFTLSVSGYEHAVPRITSVTDTKTLRHDLFFCRINATA
jgi:hypothetical protein